MVSTRRSQGRRKRGSVAEGGVEGGREGRGRRGEFLLYSLLARRVSDMRQNFNLFASCYYSSIPVELTLLMLLLSYCIPFNFTSTAEYYALQFILAAQFICIAFATYRPQGGLKVRVAARAYLEKKNLKNSGSTSKIEAQVIIMPCKYIL